MAHVSCGSHFQSARSRRGADASSKYAHQVGCKPGCPLCGHSAAHQPMAPAGSTRPVRFCSGRTASLTVHRWRQQEDEDTDNADRRSIGIATSHGLSIGGHGVNPADAGGRAAPRPRGAGRGGSGRHAASERRVQVPLWIGADRDRCSTWPASTTSRADRQYRPAGDAAFVLSGCSGFRGLRLPRWAGVIHPTRMKRRAQFSDKVTFTRSHAASAGPKRSWLPRIRGLASFTRRTERYQ